MYNLSTSLSTGGYDGDKEEGVVDNHIYDGDNQEQATGISGNMCITYPPLKWIHRSGYTQPVKRWKTYPRDEWITVFDYLQSTKMWKTYPR